MSSSSNHTYNDSIKKRLTKALLISISAGLAIIISLLAGMFVYFYRQWYNTTISNLIEIQKNGMMVLAFGKRVSL